MKVIIVKQIYRVDSLTQEKGWIKIYEYIKDMTEDIVLDFTGINVETPWTLGTFKEIVDMPNVKFKFKQNEDFYKHLKVMFILSNADISRVENEVVEVKQEKSPDTDRIKNNGSRLIPFFEDINGECVFKVHKKYTQVENTNSIEYMKYAIEEISNTNKTTKFLLEFGATTANSTTIEALANMVDYFHSKGIQVDIDMENQSNAKEMGLHLHKLRELTDNSYKENYIRNMVENHPKMAGILIKYKPSKTTDNLGRTGKGEAIMARVAVLEGIDDNNNLVFRTFDKEGFYTHIHWEVQHDNEELTALRGDVFRVGMDEVGFMDEFMGVRFHFIEPIQRSESESEKVIYGLDDNGSNISAICTIPERMKHVFDDWNIEYNTEMLDKAIKETRERLGM